MLGAEVLLSLFELGRAREAEDLLDPESTRIPLIILLSFWLYGC